MSPKPKNASAEVLEEGLGSLNGCFVDGDAEQRKRAQRVRRRALAISIFVQSLVLIAVVVLPLLAKPEPLVYAYVTPIPPYKHYRSISDRPPAPHPHPTQNLCRFCAPTSIPPTISMHDQPVAAPEAPDGEIDGTGTINLGVKDGEIPLSDARNSGPKSLVTETHAQPRVIKVTTIDPAMLMLRVQPDYPFLAKQTHREGKVELHAVISTDGTIQSLQVITGDTLFIQSAMDAVRQWRYRPTILNGVPVEVDTHITVVYTLGH